jgi:O-antigen/teichoic acid export membrane protein
MSAEAKSSLNQMNVSGRVARNTVVQMVGRVMSVVLSLAALMILTRYLGSEGTGDYLLVLSLLALLNISDMGVFTIAVRELSSGEGNIEKLLGNAFFIRVASAVLAMVLVSVVGLLLGYRTEITVAIAIASLSYLFTAMGTGSLAATFAANLRMEFQALATVVQALSFIGLVGLVVSLGLGLIPLILAYDASVLANAVVVVLSSRRFVIPRFQLDLRQCRTLFAASLPAGVANMAWVAYNRVDIVMLSKMEGAKAVGLYGLVYRFVEAAFPFGFFFVVSVYPLFSRYYRSADGDGLRNLLQKSVDVMTLLVVGLATVVIVFAKPILNVVASSEFLPAATSLRILALSVIIIWVGMVINHALLATGRQAALMWMCLAGLVVNVGLNLILIPRFSYDGAAVATVLTELVVLGTGLFILARHLGYLPSFGVAAKMAPVALASGLAALLAVPGGIVLQGAALVAVFVLGLTLTRVVTIDGMRALLTVPVRGETT